jgi:Predicted membrane protein (DUF2078).
MATLVTLAQYRMYGDHMDSGWGWGMAALMVLAVVAIVALVVWFVRSPGAHHARAEHTAANASTETPMQILDRRLAHGEIAPDEYKERAAILDKR